MMILTPQPRPTVDRFSPLRVLFILLCGLGMSALDQCVASAQMFGARTLGRPVAGRGQPGAGAGSVEDVGVVTGAERFLRDNRARGDFVGSAQGSLDGFVGRRDAIGTGRVRAATETLRPEVDRSARINRPLTQPAKGAMYNPRLALDMLPPPNQTPRPGESIESFRPSLQQRLSTIVGQPIEVIQDGDVAIIRGEVDSTKTADRLALMLSFEPQIYQIRNELRIRQP